MSTPRLIFGYSRTAYVRLQTARRRSVRPASAAAAREFAAARITPLAFAGFAAARVAPAPHTSRVAHLLNVRPGSCRILVALTTAKVLGALATSAAAVSLPILFPRLLRLKVRESFLRTKGRQLGRDLATVSASRRPSGASSAPSRTTSATPSTRAPSSAPPCSSSPPPSASVARGFPSAFFCPG